jgi:hypothetical protein
MYEGRRLSSGAEDPRMAFVLPRLRFSLYFGLSVVDTSHATDRA